MSEILSNIVIEQTNINFSPDNNNINITPEPIALNIYTGGVAVPGGNVGELQYNNGTFAGIPTVTYTSGNLSLGNVSNVKLGGGTNGYVLQTDGTGNLTWTNAPTANAGNGIPGGSNTQIQYNDAGLFGGSSGFTFNKVTGNVNFPANAIANVFVGNLYGTANIATIANSATTAGTVTTAAQPNITSIGTLTSLTVDGTTSIQQAIEKATLDGTPATGTINFDVLSQAILYKTANATANFTLNIRGNSTTTFNSITSSGQSITISLLNTNGVTPYYANVIQIDGTTVTPKYVLNNTPTSGTSTGIDQYIFNIIKTAANTYTVLGSKIGFL